MRDSNNNYHQDPVVDFVYDTVLSNTDPIRVFRTR